MDRRTFLKDSVGLTLTATAIVSGKSNSANKRRRVSPNERINVAMVGLGNRGTTLTRYFLKNPEVEITYLCDVNRSKFASATALVDDERGNIPKRVQDFRAMLADDDVDAVVVATGHNWHALATIWSCQAGKDVYVEKPMSLTLYEGRKMVEAARKYKRIVQVGSQTNSAGYYRDSLDYVRSGKLGDILLVRSQVMERSRKTIQPKPDQQAPVPEGLDWDMWCGPAPLRGYWPGTWWWRRWDYSLGGLTDHAAHQMAMIRAFLNVAHPKSVYCTGGVFHHKDGREQPDSQYAVFEYEKQNVVFQGSHWSPYFVTPFHTLATRDGYPDWLRANRIEILGTNAMLLIARLGAGWQVYAIVETAVAGAFGRRGDEAHVANFLECIRTRKKPNADVEQAHQAMSLMHIANASLRAGGRKLLFDAKSETFVNDKQANQFLKRKGRAPWLVPDEV